MLYFLCRMIVALFIIRFHVNLYRLSSNHVVHKLNHFTQPLTQPFTLLMPRAKRDYPALIVGFLLTILISALLVSAHHLTSMLIQATLIFIFTWFDVIFYSLILTTIGSWLQADPRQYLMQIAYACHHWILSPIQRYMPTIAGLDFSPMVVLLLLQFSKHLLLFLLLS